MEITPLVSIIVPVYNVGMYLEQCLESLIGQTYENIEIICVNDGATDNSAEILEKYASQDSRVKIITQKNTGLSGARNTGIQAVAGKYIMFVDGDDWIDTDTCASAVEVAEKISADLVFWSYTKEYEDSTKEKYMFWEDQTIFEEEAVKSQLHRRICGLMGEELAHPEYSNALETAWGKLYKADILLEHDVKFVDTKKIGTEDALFNLYALGFFEKAIYIRKCFNHYRKTNQTSLTKTYNDKLFERWKTLFEYMETYIEKNHLSKEYSDALNNRVALSLVGLGLNIVGSGLKLSKKAELLQQILHDSKYQMAYQNLNFQYFPVHWKLFFWFAKKKCSWGVLCLLLVMRKIVSG